jgi:hypothetical protein
LAVKSGKNSVIENQVALAKFPGKTKFKNFLLYTSVTPYLLSPIDRASKESSTLIVKRFTLYRSSTMGLS